MKIKITIVCTRTRMQTRRIYGIDILIFRTHSINLIAIIAKHCKV